jgi:hypothetical protein
LANGDGQGRQGALSRRGRPAPAFVCVTRVEPCRYHPYRASRSHHPHLVRLGYVIRRRRAAVSPTAACAAPRLAEPRPRCPYALPRLAHLTPLIAGVRPVAAPWQALRKGASPARWSVRRPCPGLHCPRQSEGVQRGVATGATCRGDRPGAHSRPEGETVIPGADAGFAQEGEMVMPQVPIQTYFLGKEFSVPREHLTADSSGSSWPRREVAFPTARAPSSHTGSTGSPARSPRRDDPGPAQRG